jgi:hypothetical protein
MIDPQMSEEGVEIGAFLDMTRRQVERMRSFDVHRHHHPRPLMDKIRRVVSVISCSRIRPKADPEDGKLAPYYERSPEHEWV